MCNFTRVSSSVLLKLVGLCMCAKLYMCLSLQDWILSNFFVDIMDDPAVLSLEWSLDIMGNFAFVRTTGWGQYNMVITKQLLSKSVVQISYATYT